MATYGERTAEHFRLERAPALVRTLRKNAQFAATRLIETNHHHGMTTPIPVENSYAINLHFIDFIHGQLWLDGRATPTDVLKKGHIDFYDLRQDVRYYFESPFDCVQFYLTQSVLDHLADENGLSRIGGFKVPIGTSIADPIMANLGAALLPALERPEDAETIFVDHVAFALGAHLARAYGGLRLSPAPARSGLSKRQERLAKELLSGCLDAEVRLPEVAGACGLPVRRFVRAFRQTTGMPPHRWLRSFRVERAKDLLLHTDLTLTQVAYACGFADQSHFSRVFAASAGTPPGQWRRRRHG